MRTRARWVWFVLLCVALGWTLAPASVTQVDGGPHKRGSSNPTKSVNVPNP